MKLKTLLTINAAIAVPTGLACILAPARLLSFYGVVLSGMGLVVYQFWGVTLVGLGALTWLARNTQEPKIQKALAATMAIIHALSCLIAVRGQSAGANALGWSMVGLFGSLALGFASSFLAAAKGTAASAR